MNKIKSVFKTRKKLIFAAGVALVVLTLFLSISLRQTSPVVKPPISAGNQNPPVVQSAPELKFIAANPPEGPQETFDVFAQTFFEFSADVDQSTARVSVSPNIAVKATVYSGEKKVLVIEPTKKPWADGVEYTITIAPGLRGIAGEELTQEVKYTFSNTEPAVFEGGDPVLIK